MISHWLPRLIPPLPIQSLAETQIAQSLVIYNSQAAGKAVKAATDLTNELLSQNAENLRTANAEIRSEIERGVFDIEVVKKANDDLIAAIQESLRHRR